MILDISVVYVSAISFGFVIENISFNYSLCSIIVPRLSGVSAFLSRVKTNCMLVINDLTLTVVKSQSCSEHMFLTLTFFSQDKVYCTVQDQVVSVFGSVRIFWVYY